MSKVARHRVAVSAMLASSVIHSPSSAQSREPAASKETQDAKHEAAFPSPSAPLRFEAVGEAGFGKTHLSTRESVNAYGPGLGLRAAYLFDFGGILGLRYDHFFGTTSSYPVPLVALTEYRTSVNFFATQLGFEWAISPMILRPHVDLGLIAVHKKSTCTPVSGTFSDLGKQMCDLNDRAETSRSLAAAPGLLMGLGTSRYYGFVDVQYYVNRKADAFGVAGGVGITL